jgi:hypothetical protein
MKRNKKLLSGSLLIAIILLMAANALGASINYTETWDNNSLAQWMPNTIASNVAVDVTGGNPDGLLRTWGTLSNDSFDIGAETQCEVFTGDYAAAGVTGIAVDVNFVSGSFDAAWLRLRFMDASHNGWVYPLTAVFGNVWQTYSVNFDPTWTDVQAQAAGWMTDIDAGFPASDSNSFAETLSDIYSAEVRISGVNDVVAAIDNFTIMVAEDICGSSKIVPLCMGKHNNVGTVTVHNDTDNLYVTYDINDPNWYLVETHVAVATSLAAIPQTKKGNPKVGHFPDSNDHDPNDMLNTYTVVIPLSSLGGDSLVIAAHTAIQKIITVEPLETMNETAWADGCSGTSFLGKNWATYLTFTVQPCENCMDED